MLIYDPANTNGLPQTPTGMSPAPLGGVGVSTTQSTPATTTGGFNPTTGMAFTQQQLQQIFGAGGSNTVNGGLLSGALTNLGNIPAIQTLGQAATAQQTPEWIRLAMQSGQMNNPYASQVPQVLNQDSRNPMQASDLRAPDTSRNAYNQFLAMAQFGPGGVPTYDQWAQGRNQQFQQQQQFLQMSPEQQAAQIQAMNGQKVASLGMPMNAAPLGGQPPNQPMSLAQALAGLNQVNPGAINPAIVNPVRPTPAAPVNLSQAIANVRAPQPSTQDRFNAFRARNKFSTNWR